MKLELKQIGSFSGKPSSIIELKVIGDNAEIVEELTNSKNVVDYDFIQNLRDIADELEEHNQLVFNETEFK